MLHMFAAVDPQTTLASGNILAVLALIIVTLAGVLALVTRYFTKKLDQKDIEIKELNKIIYADGKTHAADYQAMAKDNQEVLQSNSQTIALFGAKIEVVRGNK